MRDVAPPPGHELRGQRSRESAFRALGLGVVTGACDADPVAIGTYASAGASFDASFLWTAPVTFPMMYAVVYLSSKVGQVTGKGLFHVIGANLPAGVAPRSAV
jgi:Mn2+/Fe2+ NRAMP family transporter